MQAEATFPPEYLVYGLRAFLREARRQEVHQGFEWLLSRHHRVQVHPCLTPRKSAILDFGEQPGHNDTRFPRSARSNNCQETRIGLFSWCEADHLFQPIKEFLHHGIPPKEIGPVVLGKGAQPLVGVARLKVEERQWCLNSGRTALFTHKSGDDL